MDNLQHYRRITFKAKAYAVLFGLILLSNNVLLLVLTLMKGGIGLLDCYPDNTVNWFYYTENITSWQVHEHRDCVTVRICNGFYMLIKLLRVCTKC